MAATATAALVKLPLANCLLVLNFIAANAFSMTGNAGFQILTTCGIAVNSNSGSAFSAVGNISVQASAIQVVGGVNKAGDISLDPTPTTHVTGFSDPFASVPAPSYVPSHCDYTRQECYR